MKALIAFAVVVTSAPVIAAATEEGASAQSKERLICRRVPNLSSSSSRLNNQRVCRTAAQWRALSDASVDENMSSLGAMSQDINSPVNGFTQGESRSGMPKTGPN
jgi:hypothetical protein